jgi:peptide/nickel transport system permease protein
VDTSGTISAEALATQRAGRLDGIRAFFGIIRRNHRAFAGLLILIFFVLMALVGPQILTLDNTARYSQRLQAPSWSHPLGTDYAGRDTAVQFVHGANDVITLSLLTALFTVTIAFLVGGMAGVAGGALDSALMFVTNIILTVPSFPIMMVLAMVVTITDPFSFALVLSIWSWAGLARAIRSQILSLKNREFIEASRILGLGLPHIVFREMLPNMASYVAYHFIMIMRNAVTASVGLMVLGLVPFSATHWGMMLNLAMTSTGAVYGSTALIYFVTPIMGIMLFQMGCLFFASGMEEAFNPRLRTQ